MARVPVYAGGTIERAGLSPARLRAVDNGPGVGEGLKTLGRSLTQVSEAETRLAELRAEEEARRLDTEHMRAIRPLRLRARQARGITARDTATAVEQEMGEVNSRLIESASSPLARRMLESTVTRRTEQEMESISTYALGQEAQAIDAGREARANALIEDAIDHAEEPTGLVNLEAAVNEVRQRGQFNGWDEATTRTQILATRSRFHTGRARRLFEAGDAEGAVRVVEESRSEMTADDEAGIRRMARGEIEANETERDIGEVLAGAGAPPGAAEGRPTATGAPGAITTELRAGTVAGRRLSPAVVAGILGNAEVELPSFNPRARNSVGDNGTAFGQFQWRAERVANFQRVIGVHPRDATPQQSARFVLWELNNPRAAGMTIAQRDAIINARTPAEAARLFDQYYERSSGAHRQQRVAAAERHAGGAGGATPDGTRIDLAAAYAYIDSRQDWSESRRRRAREGVRGRASLNDQIIQRTEQDAEREIATAMDNLARNGGRLTSLTQLPAAALSRAAPGTLTTLQQTIAANNRREEPRPNSEVSTRLAVMAASDPNGFLRQNIGIYRGQITDAEVQELTLTQERIRNRSGPQPSQILGVINFVLPQTSILPVVEPNATGTRRREQEAARSAAEQQARGSILAAVQRRILLTHGSAEVTQDQVLAAVRAEVTQTTINGQSMPIYQARERGARQFPVAIPNAAIPSIVAMLQRAGMPNTPNNRVQIYLQNRDMIDRAVSRGGP